MTSPENTAEGSEWPSVTVVVLDSNGPEHLPDCFSSLTNLDYPADRLESMLVSHGSTEDSLDYLPDHGSGVRVVEGGEDLSPVGGRNLAAHRASSEYVVFLDSDMTVDPGLVRGLVDALGSDPDAVSAAAKILNWEATRFEFTGSTCNLAGVPARVRFEEPYDPERYTETTPTLFACAGAMIVDRQLFLDAGGFDDEYLTDMADVDLGWRLWLMGHKVVFAPDATAYRHRNEETIDASADHRKAFVVRRNALCSMLKNYGDDTLARVFPAVLFGTTASVVEQAVDAGYLDLGSFSITSSLKLGSSSLPMDKVNLSGLVALQEIASELPRWMEKRRVVQSRRKRPDEEIVHLFRPFFPASPPWGWPETMYSVSNALGVQDVFTPSPRRVLVVSPDVLPYPGLPTVGSGLRAWGLGQGLRARGHDVIFSMPRGAVDRFEERVPAEVARLAWGQGGVSEVIRAVEPDVVLVSGWPVMGHLDRPPDVPLILDQHGPHMLEREFQDYGTLAENTAEKLRALAMADYFICAGERQFEYFQEWLTRAGWSEEERRERSAAILVSLSPELPDRRPGPDMTFVYGGMFLPWQDPTAALTALVDELDRRKSARLLLFGGRHPFYPVEGRITEELLTRLEQNPHVVAPKMVSHDELIDTYATAHVAIDVMKANAERELAFTTRTVEYLWCGLPVIYNDYAELAHHIREYEAGWTVDPEDVEAIAGVISEIFEHPEEVEARGRNAQRLVRDRLTWDRTIHPVDHFVRHPDLRRGSSRERTVSIPDDVAMLVQRLGAVLPAPVRRRARRLVRSIVGADHRDAEDADQPVPPELVLFLYRVRALVPPSITHRARKALGHFVRA